MKHITSRLFVVVLLSTVLGFGGAYAGCSWTWEQDGCNNVGCTSGCYDNGSHGSIQSLCNVNNGLCCHCWYRRVYCSLNGTTTDCPYSTSSPNGKAWETNREEASGKCASHLGYPGSSCLTVGADPF